MDYHNSKQNLFLTRLKHLCQARFMGDKFFRHPSQKL